MKAISLSKISIIILILFPAIVIPQQSKLSKSVNYITEFIASEYFLKLKSMNPDIALVDSIYLRSIKFNNGDNTEALLSLTFATIPYRKVPIVFPILNFQLEYPLVSADEKIFLLKNDNLPKYLFYDSPESDYGDKDKLAHFFGNAFIVYSENILDLSALIGYFVESFEEDFKADSHVDYRDLDVNFYGDMFGKMLSKNKNILPSQVILIRSFRYIVISL